MKRSENPAGLGTRNFFRSLDHPELSARSAAQRKAQNGERTEKIKWVLMRRGFQIAARTPKNLI
jgi:hypothetical protein